MKFNNILKIFVIFSILGFSFSSFLALNHNMGNGHSEKTSSCALMIANSNSCQMNIGEHLLIWQATFSASINSGFIFIINLLASLLFISYIKYVGTDPPRLFIKKYENENRLSNFFNYLLSALSKGIVHPEIYA